MAEGYAPDFPQTRPPQRPVDRRTLAAMAGTRQMYSGMGSLFSIHESGAGKAAKMAAYNQIGAESAENLRNRFYQKEWEQVHNTRVQPLIQRLQAAKMLFEQQSSIAMRPVQSVIGLEEGEAAAMAGARASAPTPEGTPNAGPEVPPNPALTAGQVGAMKMSEQLSIINPMTGQPIAYDSQEGYAVYQKMVDDFWGEYQAVNVEMMDIIGEYQGNPFADYAASTIIENTMKQAGQGVTGKTDPIQQQQHMMDMEKQRAETEAQQMAAAAAREQAMSLRGTREAEISALRARTQEDPGVNPYLPRDLAEKLQAGEPLTLQEQHRAQGIYRTYTKEQAADVQMAARQGIFRMPTQMMNVPTNWQSHLSVNDKRYNDLVDAESANFTSQIVEQVARDPQGYVDAHPELSAEQKTDILNNQFRSPAVQLHLENAWKRSPNFTRAQNRAFAQRTHELMTQDGRVSGKVQEVINRTRDTWTQQGAWTDSLEEYAQTNPAGLFVSLMKGQDSGWEPLEASARRQQYRADKRAQVRQAPKLTFTTVDPQLTGRRQDAPISESTGDLSQTAPQGTLPNAEQSSSEPSAGPSTIGSVKTVEEAVPERPLTNREIMMGGRRDRPRIDLGAEVQSLLGINQSRADNRTSKVRPLGRDTSPPRGRMAGIYARRAAKETPVDLKAKYAEVKDQLGGITEQAFLELLNSDRALPSWLEKVRSDWSWYLRTIDTSKG